MACRVVPVSDPVLPYFFLHPVFGASPTYHGRRADWHIPSPADFPSASCEPLGRVLRVERPPRSFTAVADGACASNATRAAEATVARWQREPAVAQCAHYVGPQWIRRDPCARETLKVVEPVRIVDYVVVEQWATPPGPRTN